VDEAKPVADDEIVCVYESEGRVVTSRGKRPKPEPPTILKNGDRVWAGRLKGEVIGSEIQDGQQHYLVRTEKGDDLYPAMWVDKEIISDKPWEFAIGRKIKCGGKNHEILGTWERFKGMRCYQCRDENGREVWIAEGMVTAENGGPKLVPPQPRPSEATPSEAISSEAMSSEAMPSEPMPSTPNAE